MSSTRLGSCTRIFWSSLYSLIHRNLFSTSNDCSRIWSWLISLSRSLPSIAVIHNKQIQRREHIIEEGKDLLQCKHRYTWKHGSWGSFPTSRLELKTNSDLFR